MTHIVTTQKSPHFPKFLLAVALEPAEIGKRIAAARKRRGWTQLQLSYEANVSPSTVQRWESGRLPPVRELMRLADVLGVQAEEFIEPSEEDQPTSVQLADLRAQVSAVVDSVDRIETLLQELRPARRPAPKASP